LAPGPRAVAPAVQETGRVEAFHDDLGLRPVPRSHPERTLGSSLQNGSRICIVHAGIVLRPIELKLHLYILRELLVSFAFTLGGILVLTLPAIAAIAVHKLAGVKIMLVLLYIPLIQTGMIPYILPLAFLLAVVVTYGRLAADNEWTAIRMSGRNPAACLMPGAVMAVALGIV